MVVKELLAKLGLEVDETSFEKGEALIHGLHAGFLAFAGAAVAGIAVVGAAFAKGFADSANEANRFAQRIGLPLEAAQELGFAAEASGASVESLQTALGHLASTGVKDLQKELFRLAEEFHKMPDGAGKIALARKAFGRGGQELIPLLNKGTEGIRELMQEADELGVVLGKDDVTAAREFKRSLHEFEAASKAAGYAIGRALLPYATKLVQALNRLGHALHGIPQLFRENIQWVKAFAVVLTSVGLAAILSHIGALAALAGGYIAAGAAAVFAAIQATVAWLAAASPFIALAAAIAFVLLALEDLYQFLTGGESVIGDFVQYVKDEFGTWKGFFSALADWVQDVLSKLWDGIIALVKAAPIKFVESVMAAINSIPGGQKLLTFGLEAANDVGDLLGTGLSAVFGGGASPAASVGARVSPGNTAPLVQAPTFNGGNITINASPGMDVKDIADQVAAKQEEFWDSKMRELQGGTD